MLLALLALPRPAAADTTQANSQGTAAQTNHKGSDDDIDEATSNGVMALMNLAALNIPGAFAKGYEAYGNYLNSNKMDDLEAKTKALKGTMNSIGTDQASNLNGIQPNAAANANSEVSGTVFKKRVSPENLRSGKAAVLSAEFEKRTGMSREELLMHFNSAVDAKLNYNDPDLLNKLETRFHAFRDRIPNKEFREGLQKAEDLFPQPMKQKVLGEIMAFYNSSISGGKPDAKLAAAGAAGAGAVADVKIISAEKPAAVAAAAQEGSDTERPAENRRPASAIDDLPVAARADPLLGLNGDGEVLKNYLNAAAASEDEITIFRQVTARYRKITPKLTKF